MNIKVNNIDGKIITKININKYDKIIFDCDGVVFDSNNLKTSIFKKTLEAADLDDKIIEEFINYHKNNGGVSRYEKFYYLEKEVLKNEFPGIKDKLLISFSNNVKQMYLKEAKYIEGLISFLKILYKYNKECFINSGSNQDELRDVFLDLNISKYFKKIFGSPKNKFEIINESSEFSNIHNEKVLFFGDSLLDYRVSKEFNFDFIFVDYNSDYDYKMIKDSKLMVIKNYLNILSN